MEQGRPSFPSDHPWHRRLYHFVRGLRRRVKWLLLVALVLLGVRLALPVGLEWAVNRRLAAVPGYTGEVRDIDVALFRGAYQLKGLRLIKTEGNTLDEPLIQAKEIDFSIAWRELFHGYLLGEIHAEEIGITLVQGTSATDTQTPSPVERRWQEVINDLFPIEITHLTVVRGELRFFNDTGDLPYDIRLRDVTLEAADLRNRSRPDDSLPATLRISATTDAGGQVDLEARGEPLADQPHFDLNLAVQHVALPKLNDFLRTYANVDVRAGSLSVYGELAASNGHFEGYIKPFLNEVDFTDTETQNKPLTSELWEAIVSGLAFIFKNHSRDQLGTRVPIRGEFNEVDVSTLATIGNTVRHAFIQAFSERIDHTVGEGDQPIDPPPLDSPDQPDESP